MRKKYKNAWEYFMANWGNLLGGFSAGMALPLGNSMFGNLQDFIIFAPIAVILLGISAYYKFYKYE